MLCNPNLVEEEDTILRAYFYFAILVIYHLLWLSSPFFLQYLVGKHVV